MTNEVKPSDHLFHGIAALDGWGSLLWGARNMPDAAASRVGMLISGILVAAGEEAMPVTISGELDDEGTGTIWIFYPAFIVVVTAEQFRGTDGTVKIELVALESPRVTAVQTRHNYFDGTHRYQRSTGIAFSANIGGHDFTFTSRQYSDTPLLDAESVLSALEIVRARVAGGATVGVVSDVR